MRNYRLNNSERKFINEIQTLTPNKNLATREINLLDANGNNLKSYQISDLTPFLKGMLYERMVGIHFENNGYDVEYCGLNKGVLDQGIDLICRKPEQPTCYIQCKSGGKTVGKQGIETILYKGGNFIAKNENHKCRFILAIETEKLVSTVNRRRFMQWNQIQSKVRLEIKTLTW